MRYQHLIYFFEERLKRSTSLPFFSVKFALAAPKIMYLDTYIIFFNALSNGLSVKGNNQDSEITGTMESSVLNLSSSYTDPYLLSEFRRIS